MEDEIERVESILENDLGLTSKQRKDLEAERDRLKNTRNSLQNQVSTLNAEKTRLQSDLRQKQSELNEVKRERDRLEQERNNARRDRDDARQERDSARRERDDARSEAGCWKKTEVGLCSRPTELQTAILAKLSDISDCADVHYCHLEEITELDLSGDFDPASDSCSDHDVDYQPEDFSGLTELEELNLSGVCLDHFESYKKNTGFFSELDAIERINLQETNIVKLSKHFFNGVLDTLDDGGVHVTGFIYCGDPESPYKSKLGPSSEVSPHNDPDYQSVPNMQSNCY